MNDTLRKEVICLTRKILSDLKLLGISPHELKYNIDFKHYSKRYYGRYIRKNQEGEYISRVFVYLFKNPEKTELYAYQDLLSTTVHEVCHHIQYEDPDFVRKKGVMHDKQFWDLYNSYMNRYFELTQEKGGKRYADSIKKSIRKGSNPTT